MSATIYLKIESRHIGLLLVSRQNQILHIWLGFCKIWFFLYKEPVADKNGVEYGYPESD